MSHTLRFIRANYSYLDTTFCQTKKPASIKWQQPCDLLLALKEIATVLRGSTAVSDTMAHEATEPDAVNAGEVAPGESTPLSQLSVVSTLRMQHLCGFRSVASLSDVGKE
jgi:hypothetical protein